MQLANQASQLSLLDANFVLAQIIWYGETTYSGSPSKYGHYWLQKTKMATTKIQTRGFKTAAHKPMGDITDASFIIYTVYGEYPGEQGVPEMPQQRQCPVFLLPDRVVTAAFTSYKTFAF